MTLAACISSNAQYYSKEKWKVRVSHNNFRNSSKKMKNEK
jgi:hypothetical protein